MSWFSILLWMALVILPCSLFGQTDFFFSFSDLNSGATNSNAAESTELGETGTIYLYYGTVNSELDTGAGLDVFLSNSGVIEFTSAETLDFGVALSSDPSDVEIQRWGTGFGPAGDVQSDVITALMAFTIPSLGEGTGIVNANEGSGTFIDLGYDQGSQAFLFAKIEYKRAASV